jgi:hypothetical protein
MSQVPDLLAQERNEQGRESFFFRFHLSPPRGTEPHVGLRERTLQLERLGRELRNVITA